MCPHRKICGGKREWKEVVAHEHLSLGPDIFINSLRPWPRNTFSQGGKIRTRSSPCTGHCGSSVNTIRRLSGSAPRRYLIVARLCFPSLTFMLNIGLLSQRARGPLREPAVISVSASPVAVSHPFSERLSRLPWQFTLTTTQKSPQRPQRPRQIDN